MNTTKTMTITAGLSNFFQEITVSMMTKAPENLTNKNYSSIFPMNIRAKTLNKIFAIKIQEDIKKIIQHGQVVFIA